MEPKKILIADDDEVFLKLAERDLTRAGYAVLKARNGKDALDLAKLYKPDLAILDIDMPEMDGSEVGRLLREDRETEHIPVMYLTGLLRKSEERKSGRVISGSFFMAKPYEPQEFLTQIKQRIR